MKATPTSLRVKAWALIGLFIFEVLTPGLLSTASAQGDPSYDSFMPANNSQLVDPFTGDFTYNIPLMEVPGSRGSFPLNLHYRAGMSMNQEASWVGFGWFLNPGAVTRNLSGIPDDFSGQERIIRTQYKKPNISVSLDAAWTISNMNGVSMETLLQALENTTNQDSEGQEDIIGENAPYINHKQALISHSNYSGFDLTISKSKSYAVLTETGKLDIETIPENTFSSVSGSFKNPFSPFGKLVHGIKDDFSESKWNKPFLHGKAKNYKNASWTSNLSIRSRFSFEVPRSQIPITTKTIGFELSNWQPELTAFKWESGFGKAGGTLNLDYVSEDNLTQDLLAFGCIYPDKNQQENSLEDFTLDNYGPITKRTPIIPSAIQNNDSWTVSGLGMSGDFRCYTYDFGVYSPNAVTSDIEGFDGGVETGVGGSKSKIGLDISVYLGSTYNGPWSSDSESLERYDFHQGGEPLEEEFYFEMEGELVAQKDELLDAIGGEDPSAFQLVWGPSDTESGGFLPAKKVRTLVGMTDPRGVTDRFKSRRTRSTSIKHKSYSQLESALRTVTKIDGTLPEDIFVPVSETEGVEGAVMNGKQIAEFEITGTDGSKLVYGIPQFVKNTINGTFRTNDLGGENANLIEHYDAPLNGKLHDIKQGFDHFSSKDEIPSYTYTHLISEIFSADYIDFKGDGPTADDAGFWVKFNYTKGLDFEWRTPYAKGFTNLGDLSNKLDDSFSYSYGEREQSYVEIIETDTHYALFFLEERLDNRPAKGGEHNQGEANLSSWSAGECSYALDKIQLYKKKGVTPNQTNDFLLQTTDFKYDYLLCGGTPSSAATGQKKLTLVKVFTTFQDSEREENIYTFDYDHENGDRNPDFDLSSNDRWGNYQQNYGIERTNGYTNQYNSAGFSEEKRNSNASAWAVREITSPGGSVMQIEYEADRYKYVQDQHAMAMHKIFGTTWTGQTLDGIGNNKITENFRRIYFELPQLENGLTYPDDAFDSVIGEMVFFKCFTDLKQELENPGGPRAQDYVESWAKVSNTGVELHSDGVQYGFVIVEPVSASSLGLSNVNPLQLAGWENIRLYRPDLTNFMVDGDDTFDLSDFTGYLFNFMNAWVQSAHQIVSFYPMAKALGWSNKIVIGDEDFPSFIRMPIVQYKYGGGHRVKSIKSINKWDERNDSNGEDEDFISVVNYTYENHSEVCSGVASSEPMSGNEESALIHPLEYNQSNHPVSLRSNATFSELPVGIAYFPNPIVGYSNVIIETIGNSVEINGPNYLGQGISEIQHYTSKDFPTRARRTNLSSSNGTLLSKWVPIPIPYVGWQVFRNQGFSQGISIVTNNMHGKIKSQSSFSKAGYVESVPSSKTEYLYHTNEFNELASEVDVMTELGYVDKRSLGLNYDYFIHFEENNHWNTNVGVMTGLNGEGPIFMPNWQPDGEYTHSNVRKVSATKVIYRSGILKEVITTKDGSSASAQTLVYCSQGTSPVLSSMENEWRENIYSFSQPAYPFYSNTKGDWSRYRTTLELSTGPIGEIISPETGTLNKLLFDGDEIIFQANGEIEHAWVVWNGTEFVLYPESGLPLNDLTNITASIVTPSARNWQSTRIGNVVAMNNPIDYLYIDDFLIQWNAMMAQAGAALDPQEVTDSNVDMRFDHRCLSDELQQGFVIQAKRTYTDDIAYTELTILPEDPLVSGECGSLTLNFEDSENVQLTTDGEGYQLQVEADEFQLLDQNGKVLVSVPVMEHHVDWFRCVGQNCIQVLHADAVVLEDEWDETYLSSKAYQITDEEGFVLASSSNEQRYGKKGIERPKQTFLYITDRNQEDDPTTKIDRDGLYPHFKWFDWRAQDPIVDNPEWIWKTQTDFYTVDGVAIQASNDIPSSNATLVDIDGGQVLAESANAQAHEIASESFELNAGDNSYFSGNGNIQFTSGGNINVVSTYAHTGNFSLQVSTTDDVVMQIDPSNTQFDVYHPSNVIGENAKAFISVWAFTGNGAQPSLTLTSSDSGIPIVSTLADPSKSIDGWARLQLEYDFSNPSATYTLALSSTGLQTYFDDFRICPSDASMATYVYDKKDRRLKAVLDDNNYATVYVYDRRGQLIQTKVETLNGIQTISTGRSVIKNP